MSEDEAMFWLSKYRKGKVAANVVIVSSLVTLGLIVAGPGGFNLISLDAKQEQGARK